MMHLNDYEWWLVGRYGAIAAVMLASWLTRQRWMPHRHTGYVAASGRVWPCSRCGRLPVIADPVTCPDCGVVRNGRRNGDGDLVTHAVADLCPRCYLAGLSLESRAFGKEAPCSAT